MKKLIALLLALMMVLVCTAALAAEGDEPDEGLVEKELSDGEEVLDTSSWVSEETTFSTNGFKKTFSTSGTSTTVYPKEELTFVSTPDTGNPDTTNITINKYTASSQTGYLTVNIPSYSKVGVYKYTIKETAGGAQGVTYTTDSVGLTVLVTYDYENKKLATEVGITKNTKGVKEDTFTNTYKLGKLTVSKTVTGNLGKKDQAFDITVTLTSAKKVFSDITYPGGSIAGDGWTGDKTISFKLKDSESFEITNIPEGVTYAVAEDEKHAANDPNGSNGATGYTVTYSGKTGTISSTADAAATVTNNKNIEVDTGVALDFVPYVLIMALALAGVALRIYRRRKEY